MIARSEGFCSSRITVYVLRSDKSNIQLLEEEWLKVATQTGWKLDPAYCYDNSDNGDAVSVQQPNEALHTAVPVDVTVSYHQKQRRGPVYN